MKIGRLKEILSNLDDDLEIYIRNSVNICGNIGELYQIEKSTYGFMGYSIPCIVLNTYYSKNLEEDEEENIIDYIETSGLKGQ